MLILMGEKEEVTSQFERPEAEISRATFVEWWEESDGRFHDLEADSKSRRFDIQVQHCTRRCHRCAALLGGGGCGCCRYCCCRYCCRYCCRSCCRAAAATGQCCCKVAASSHIGHTASMRPAGRDAAAGGAEL